LSIFRKVELHEMNVWLCPIKSRGWGPIKKLEIFGAPVEVKKKMEQVRLMTC